MKKVGIIGGAGFIGRDITKAFLDLGLEVKVSATDSTRKDKYRHLMVLNNAYNLYISKVNVEYTTILMDFVSDCDIFIHNWSFFILDVQDPQNELFDPTINGTEDILEA